MNNEAPGLIDREILAQQDYSLTARQCLSWPYEEARKLAVRYDKKNHLNGNNEIIFATGYGPSGLPHIGTFAEVARTTMVRRAFGTIRPEVKTKIICFSDDMDGLRKVPENIPNSELLQANLGRSLSSIPDPFGEYESFAAHNNARLRNFLDEFGFEYQFVSSTKMYKSGEFDYMLKKILAVHDKVKAIILPTLGEERRKNYSPFLPICPDSGEVLLAEVIETKTQTNSIVYRNPHNNKLQETEVTGGKCKLQWRPDWAMRWIALNIDYEMAGKDLINSVKLSGQICRIFDYPPPEKFYFELFLDNNGRKISKSLGNGISVEQWLRYAPKESLSYFIYRQPRRSKKLSFDVIPKNVDEYLGSLQKWSEEKLLEKLDSPIFHIHGGGVKKYNILLSFAMLLNLVSASNAQTKDILWGFVTKYAPELTPANSEFFDQLVGYAIQYFNDFVKPNKIYRKPEQNEKIAMQELAQKLQDISEKMQAEDIQSIVYEIGKKYQFENMKKWFNCLYQVLLGQSQGPRFGSFVKIYGIENTVKLIEKALTGSLAKDDITEQVKL